MGDALEASLWAFHHSSSYHEGALLAVNLGEDADTTGAFYGEDGIPAVWRDTIAQRELIVDLAEKLFSQGAA